MLQKALCAARPGLRPAGYEMVTLRDATGGWILSCASPAYPYAPMASEYVYIDLEVAVTALLEKAAGFSREEVYCGMPSLDAVINAAERSVSAAKVSNGWVITYSRRPDRDGGKGELRTAVYRDDPNTDVVEFFREKS